MPSPNCGVSGHLFGGEHTILAPYQKLKVHDNVPSSAAPAECRPIAALTCRVVDYCRRLYGASSQFSVATDCSGDPLCLASLLGPPRARTRHDPIVEWAAIGSALVLLFFAISLSDDLHQDVVLFSESSTSRRHLVVRISGADTSGNRGASAVHDGHLGSGVLPRTAPRQSLGFFGQVASSIDSSLSTAQFCHFSGSSPPAFFL